MKLATKRIIKGDETDATESTLDAEASESAAANASAPSPNPVDTVSEVADRASGKKVRRVSFSVRSLALSTLVVCLIAALGVTTWLYISSKQALAEQRRHSDNTNQAEEVALNYAVNAAIMDYKDLAPWKQNIVKGTTPELADKLTKAATAMEQIVLPLQWTSTAKPLAAKVRSEDKGVYVVDAFVSVMTKTVQAADELQSTATYAVTVDSNNAWQIADVGGIAAVVSK